MVVVHWTSSTFTRCDGPLLGEHLNIAINKRSVKSFIRIAILAVIWCMLGPTAVVVK